ncbi:hypothetical protein V490_04790, partial [Pseudogymnoascus sp. VKM F-3557]
KRKADDEAARASHRERRRRHSTRSDGKGVRGVDAAAVEKPNLISLKGESEIGRERKAESEMDREIKGESELVGGRKKDASSPAVADRPKSSHNGSERSRKVRTPEEQEAHDKRKAERRERRAREEEEGKLDVAAEEERRRKRHESHREERRKRRESNVDQVVKEKMRQGPIKGLFRRLIGA